MRRKSFPWWAVPSGGRIVSREQNTKTRFFIDIALSAVGKEQKYRYCLGEYTKKAGQSQSHKYVVLLTYEKMRTFRAFATASDLEWTLSFA